MRNGICGSISGALLIAAPVAALLLAGCSLDRTAIDDGPASGGKCVTGTQTPCTCESGNPGFNVCQNGIWSKCQGCPDVAAGGEGGADPAAGSGGAGGAEPLAGSGGEPPPPVAGTGGGPPPPIGGTGGIPTIPPVAPVVCPSPLTCQTSPYAPGVFFCAESGPYGTLPPICQTDFDCDMIGLPDAPCLGAMGISACIAVCTP